MRCLYSIYGIVLFFLLSLKATGQNMVPNGDFEAYIHCPSNASQMDSCAGWRQYHGGTSDYFNTCATASNVHIPKNNFGYQAAASGNAYAGVHPYNGIGNYKEYIARAIVPLTPGTIYEVSMSVNLADSSGFATNDLAVWFYDNGPSATIIGNEVVMAMPQVSYANYGPITDTTDWVRLTGTFVADSAYDNVVIGGFSANVTALKIASGKPLTPYAYYYIDSVVVRPTNLSFNVATTALCTGDTLKLPFNAFPGKYTSANVFSLQLSDASGSFANPLTIASKTGSSGGVFTWVVPASITPGYNYRLRIKTTDITDSSYTSNSIAIGNTKPARPLAWSNVPVCEGDTLKLNVTSATNGVSYKWSGPANFSYNGHYVERAPVLLPHAGQYIADAWLYGCVARDTLPVNVIKTVGVIGIDGTGQACTNDTLRLYATSTAPGTTYKWTGPNGYLTFSKDTSIAQPNQSLAGSYVLTGYYSGCSSQYNVGVSILPVPDSFFAEHNTPLCDGDTLKLKVSSSSAGVTYSWKGPNGFISGAQQPTIKNATSSINGLYMATATLGGCVVTDTVAVNIIPKEQVMLSTSNSPVCAGDTLKLHGYATEPGISSYLWQGPNGFSSTLKDPVVADPSLAATGRYILTGYFSGCASTDTIDIQIKPLPAGVTANTNSPVCESDTLTLTGNATNPAVTFNWVGPRQYSSTLKDNIFSNAQTALSGDYILTVMLNGCTASDTVTILVKPKPLVPELSSNSPLRVGDTLRLQINNPESGVNYAWNGPAGFNSNAVLNAIDSVTKNNAGSYTVMASKEGCSSGSLIIVQITDRPDTSFFNIYPNANDGRFTIHATVQKEQQVPVAIYAADGKEVYRTNILTEKKLLKADINLKDAVSNGLYTLRTIVDGKVHNVQLMIIRR